MCITYWSLINWFTSLSIPDKTKLQNLWRHLMTSYFASIQFNHMQRFLLVQGFSCMYQSSWLVILKVLYAWNWENRRKGHISQKNDNFKKEKNAFSDNHMLTSWFKFQLDSSSGVGCSERTYTNTYIHKYIVIVWTLRDLYFTTICSYVVLSEVK